MRRAVSFLVVVITATTAALTGDAATTLSVRATLFVGTTILAGVLWADRRTTQAIRATVSEGAGRRERVLSR